MIEKQATSPYNALMKRRIILFLWTAAMIFPLNWLRQESEFIRQRFDHVFAAEWVHIVSHLILFAGLVILAMQTLRLPLNSRSAMTVMVILFAVALLQEFFQLQVKGRGFELPEVFDLFVDIVGGLTGWGMVILLRKKVPLKYKVS